MNCKYCQAELDESSILCPACGKPQEEEIPAEEEKMTVQETAENKVPAVEETADEAPAVEETADEVPAVEETTDEAPAVEETAEDEAPDGEEAAQEEPVRKPKTWVKVAAIAGCVVLFLGLLTSIWYGINGQLLPRANDVNYKDCYTAEDDKAVKAADTVIATVGEHTLTNGQLQIYYWMEVYTFLEDYGSYLAYVGLDYTKPLSEQYVAGEETTWEQYFLSKALAKWHQYQSLVIMAEEEGVAMSQELRQNLDNLRGNMDATSVYYGFADADEMIKADMGAAASMDDYMAYMNVYYMGLEYFETLFDKVNPTAEQVEAHWNTNGANIESSYGVNKESGKLVDVRHILICPEDSGTAEGGTAEYTDEAWEACLKKAEEILETWKSGEATEASFAALANEHSEDPGSNTTGGIYSYVYKNQMVAEFDAWCFDESRQEGDTGIVKTQFGYHILYFVYGDEGWIRRAEQDYITTVCSEMMKEGMDANPLEVNYKKIVLGNANLGG